MSGIPGNKDDTFVVRDDQILILFDLMHVVKIHENYHHKSVI
jgi:hypothetical protein